MLAVRNGMTMLRADGNAFAAHRAFAGIEQQFRFEGLRLGIVAPEAMQRTAFDEDYGPDPRPVVDTELLYIENHAFGASIGTHSISSEDDQY